MKRGERRADGRGKESGTAPERPCGRSGGGPAATVRHGAAAALRAAPGGGARRGARGRAAR